MSQIEHKDFSYENRHKFEKAIKSAYEINQNLSKDKLLNEAEIGRLSKIIQTEKAQEIQKQHELQIQQSLQKSRGFDIEI